MNSAKSRAARSGILATASTWFPEHRYLREIGEVGAHPLQSRRLEQGLQIAFCESGIVGLVKKARKGLDQTVEFGQIPVLNRVAQHEEAAGLEDPRDFARRRGANFRRQFVEEINARGNVHARI